MSRACPDLAQEGQPLLRGRNLGISLGQQRILDHVDIDLYAGDVVLLRGANGCGKTTLLNVLAGHLQPDRGTLSLNLPGLHACWQFSPSPGRTLRHERPFNASVMARHGIARVWQDLRLFSNLTLIDNVAVALAKPRSTELVEALCRRRLLRKPQRCAENAATGMLAQTGVAHLGHVKAAQVSLGQAKRAALARALAGQSPVLFLDEPLAGLDQAGCHAVTELLQALISTRQITLVMIEHPCNAHFLQPLVRCFWTLDKGRVHVAQAAQTESSGSGTMPMLEKHLAHRGVHRLRQWPLPAGGRLTVFGDAPPTGPPLLQMSNVCVRHSGCMVTGVTPPFSLALHEGETALLEAPNGWGKTTLLEAIAGVRPIQDGQMMLNGVRLTHVSAWARAAAGLGFLQSRNHVFPSLSVRETLQLSSQSRVPDLLHRVEDRMAAALSGGERQLLALSCTLGNPMFGVRLLDEPFSALDDANMARVMAESWPIHGANLVAVPSSHHSEGGY